MTTMLDKARRAVRYAIDARRLVPPEVCERCGLTGPISSDGRRTIHAHHHNGYGPDFWLDVKWLCPKCHFIDDPRPSGESNGRSKLKGDDVHDIRSSPRSGLYLAAKYGVDPSTISKIRKGHTWKIDAILNERGGGSEA